jgi:hypothetical protein
MMPKLKVTISNEAGEITGDCVIDCLARPGLDIERYDTHYTINLIRAAAERHLYLPDFLEPPPLSMASLTFDLEDPIRTLHLQNVNELWLEIENLMRGARLNFATARTLKQLEDAYNEDSDFDLNLKFDLHLEKMDRFHSAVFEMARIEDLVVRLLYEFFGEQFIEVDASKEGWEKKLTWDQMKDSLNRRGQPTKQTHPAVAAMNESDYRRLLKFIRGYRSTDVLKLTRYRDVRTHRVAPSVDHPELAVDLACIPLTSGSPIQLFRQPTEPQYRFLDLYDGAKKVYSHLSQMLFGINDIIHA